jgi:hypothetical protein
MARKENRERRKASKQVKADKKSFMSDRQKRVLLGVLLLLILAVPIIDICRCKIACMKRVKTPYPEIACRYECPWPWQKSQ